MKRIIFVLTVFCAVLCGSASAQSIIGKWKTTGNDPNETLVFEFRGDGTFCNTMTSVEYDSYGYMNARLTTVLTLPGRYELQGNVFRVCYDFSKAKCTIKQKVTGGTAAENRYQEQNAAPILKQRERENLAEIIQQSDECWRGLIRGISNNQLHFDQETNGYRVTFMFDRVRESQKR